MARTDSRGIEYSDPTGKVWVPTGGIQRTVGSVFVALKGTLTTE